MYFIDVLRLLWRQWVVVLLGIIFLAGGVFGVMRYVPTEHQAMGQLILLLPADSAAPPNPPTNPYLNLPPEMTTTASLLAGSMMTRDSARDLAAQGFDSEYDVAVVPGAGPVIVVTTKDTDPAACLATRDEIIKQLEIELARIQDEVGVPDRQLITARPSSVGQIAEALPGAKVRALAVLGAMLGTLTLVVAFLRDRRRGRTVLSTAKKDEAGGEAHAA